jgi:hypothetical protein
MSDGSVCRVDQDAERHFQISDLGGKTLLNPRTGEPMTWSDVQAQRAENVSLQAPLSTYRRPRGALFRRWGGYGYWGSSSGTLWYFVQPERRLAGYDAVSRRFLGSIGPNGFANSLAGDGFTILGSRTLGTSTTLVSVNLSKRTVTPVFTASSDDPITHVGDVMINGQNWTGTLVATRQKVHFISSEGKAVWSIDYSMRYPDSEDFKAYALEPAGAFVLWNAPPFQKLKNFSQSPPAHVTWVKDGRVSESAEAPVPWRPQEWPGVQEHLMAAIAPPCLVALLPSCLGLDTMPEWRPLLAVSAIAGLICAPCVWIIARRRKVSPGGCLIWSIGTLALGLPGLLALLSIEDIRPRETPRAPASGIEIFEPGSAA